MRLHRFYVSETISNKTEININSTELANQIIHVFRLKKYDLLIIFDGSGFDYECMIKNITDHEILLSIISKTESRFIPKRNIYLFAAIIKKDTFEWIVEKATELGVTHIIPLITERTEKKSLNIDRLKKIAIEASEQSGRGTIPVIEKILTLEEGLFSVDQNQATKIVLHTEGNTWCKSDLQQISNLYLFIGPEGGWSPKEIDLFHKNNIQILSLGNQILRAETAVIATLSLFTLEK